MTEKASVITPEDLKIITDAITRKKGTQDMFERISLENKNAQLEHQAIVQHMYIKYGLTFDDSINDETGDIKRKTDEAESTDEAPVEIEKEEGSDS